jgi:hypothetical protein
MQKKSKIKINDIAPDIQECKLIILQMIGQAIKDYEYYRDKEKPEDKEIFDSAKGLLFKDSYFIDWGDEVLNLRKLCEVIDIDIDWLRNQVVKKLDIAWDANLGVLIPERIY